MTDVLSKQALVIISMKWLLFRENAALIKMFWKNEKLFYFAIEKTVSTKLWKSLWGLYSKLCVAEKSTDTSHVLLTGIQVESFFARFFFKKLWLQIWRLTSPNLSSLRPSAPKIWQLGFPFKNVFPFRSFARVANNKQNFKKLLHACNSQFVFSAVMLLSKQSKSLKL